MAVHVEEQVDESRRVEWRLCLDGGLPLQRVPYVAEGDGRREHLMEYTPRERGQARERE